MNAIAAGNHAPDWLASFWIHPKRFIFHALLHLEPADRLGGIGGFVNVDWHLILFAGALRRFWLRCSLARLFTRIKPLGVKDARLVDALVGVRAKKISLCLKQIRRQTRRSVAIEVGERGAEGRDRDPVFDCGSDRDAPVILSPFDDPGEVLVEEEIVQRRIAFIGFLDPIQKLRADDATAAPNGGDVAEIQIPM